MRRNEVIDLLRLLRDIVAGVINSTLDELIIGWHRTSALELVLHLHPPGITDKRVAQGNAVRSAMRGFLLRTGTRYEKHDQRDNEQTNNDDGRNNNQCEATSGTHRNLPVMRESIQAILY